MVTFKKLLLSLVILPLFAFHPIGMDLVQDDEVTVKVEIHDELAIENQPFFAKIIVYHPQGTEVDESSFLLGNESICAQFLSQGHQIMSSDINGEKKRKSQAISYYIFEVPKAPQGSHTLDAISVKVQDQTYSSGPVSYFVSSAHISSHFSLSGFVDAPKPLYPGQQFSATYRITTHTQEPMEVFYENLPLLDLKGCQKLGKQKKKVYYQGHKRVEEYTQKYQAKTSGSFQVEPSFLEARIFSEDFFGRRRYQKGIERAESNHIDLVVADFPKEGQPSSFNGAVGDFKINVALDSSSQVCVGDKLKLKVDVIGKKGLDTVHLPTISTQKGFKDLFRFNDLPLAGNHEDQSKSFTCELRPMQEHITEIPPVEFSYFNPETKTYHTLKSSPIAITLLPMKSSQESIDFSEVAASVQPIEEISEEALSSPEFIEDQEITPIEIKGVFEIEAPSALKGVRSDHAWLIASALFTLILLQLIWKYLKSSKPQSKDSAFYLKEALSNKKHLQNYQLLVEKSLLLRLKEQNFIKDVSTIEALGSQGIAGEVKAYIQDLQMELFSGQSSFSLEESYQKAKSIYKKIGDR